MAEVCWVGRVERKMKRKHWVELSLAVETLERTQTIFVPKNNPEVSVEHPTCLQLQALIRVNVVPRPDTDDRTWDAKKIELLECPSDPLAIKAVLQEPSLWKTLKPYKSLPNPLDNEEKKEEATAEEEDYSQVNHALIKRIVMRLQRRRPTQPRIRPPHVSFKVMKELEELENQTDLVDVRISTPDELNEGESTALASSTGWNLPQTEDNRILRSGRHKLTRQEYLASKKYPQIAWMRQRLQHFPGGGNHKIRHIVDVGGGRGDLAIELALGLGPETHVTVVDLNESSLRAGEAYAQECGVGDRMSWIYQDFNDFVESNRSKQVDMVVALHACGNLSDCALDYAVRNEASFLICPCCYSKMKDQTAATRLAEISERPDLSRRGMHIVNSQRYWDLMASNDYTILLEEYSRAWSSRNMVMIGWPNK